MPERVVAFVDGLNVYQGMVASRLRHLLWLDYVELVRQFLQQDQELGATYYFTSHRRTPPESYARQGVYLEALNTLPELTIVEGSFDRSRAPCRHCGRVTDIPRERATDVQLATYMVHGAGADEYDTAYLLSGDTDYLTPITKVQALGKKVKLLRPVARRSEDLAEEVDYVKDVRATHLRRAQLPGAVNLPDGRTIERPFSWANLEQKERRLNERHREILGSLRNATPPHLERHLHDLADDCWAIEGKARGPNALKSTYQ